MRYKTIFGILILSLLLAVGCEPVPKSSDETQKEQSEVILKDLTAQTGMPSIKNGRERKMLKDILELRDQDGLVTYTYTWSDYSGKPTYFCDSIGYGIPYATQYTNPMKENYHGPLPQADPNGLFSPASADGTWVLCKEPHTGKVRPQYIEPRILVLTYKLDAPEPESAKKAIPASEALEK